MGDLVFAAVFFIAENCYFGWNRQPSCKAERICDMFVLYLCLYALVRILIRREIKKILKEKLDK